MKKRIALFILSCFTLLTFATPSTSKVPIYNFDGGWLKEDNKIIIRCDIFQFPQADSYKKKINEIMMTEFRESISFAKNQKTPEYFKPEIRARSKVYINNSKLFSAWNKVYCSYYNIFPKAYVKDQTVNLQILPNGDVKEIKIEELFDKNSDWQTALLLKGVELLKKQKFEFWDNAKIENEIKNREEKWEFYFYSFVITNRNSIVLIYQSLSLAPNVAGYPSVEIPLSELPNYNGYLDNLMK